MVDAQWFAEHAGDAGVALLDLRPAQQYQRAHVTGSFSAPYQKWRMERKDLSGMAPSPEQMEKMLSALGVTAETHIVLLSGGFSAGDLASATRAFWTLKLIGHDKASILDGGLSGLPQPLLRKLLTQAVPAKPKPTQYVAKVNNDILATDQTILDAAKHHVGVNDARSVAEYIGLYVTPEERPGAIPGATNVPYDWITVNGGGKLRSAETLRAVFALQGVDLSKPQITYCHTGHRASLNWFVMRELLGVADVKLYDASMANWARNPERPIKALITP
ncbi:putative rhodanese [Magnetofaba australis IT-1]|uniref:Putative rhodanese n=1 Tax=Magnetofaba australis IT-1 TaxID=1434232 RepID=A0A1Y2K315_9PROT|nr:putative rhodanese [Magnetofaba australis IT-1]